MLASESSLSDLTYSVTGFEEGTLDSFGFFPLQYELPYILYGLTLIDRLAVDSSLSDLTYHILGFEQGTLDNSGLFHL